MTIRADSPLQNGVVLADEPSNSPTAATPLLTNGQAGSVTSTTMVPSVETTVTGGVMYARVYAASTTIDADDVIDGTATPLFSVQVIVSSTGVITLPTVTGLTAATSYRLGIAQEVNGVRSNVQIDDFATAGLGVTIDGIEDCVIEGGGVTPFIGVDDPAGTIVARVYLDGAAPADSDVFSGAGSPVVSPTAAITVTAIGTYRFEFLTNNLNDGQAYELFAVHQDGSSNYSNLLQQGFVVNDTPEPKQTGVTDTTVSYELTIGNYTNFTIYYRAVLRDAAPPTINEILSGQTVLGTAAALTQNGTTAFNVSNLTQENDYDVYYRITDDSGNLAKFGLMQPATAAPSGGGGVTVANRLHAIYTGEIQ